MDYWFKAIGSRFELPSDTEQELHETGFIVVPEALPSGQLTQLTAAYDTAVCAARPENISVGSTTTRVSNVVNCGVGFDQLYINPQILGACYSVIARPFKLSTMHARSVHPHAPAQSLHVDFPRYDDGWPMVGFIIMIDPFRCDNGATRFVPRSHNTASSLSDPAAADKPSVTANGPAGSMIIYNGSIWHGHSANRTGEPRRSIQGAYIRRDAEAAVNYAEQINQETLRRISPLAKYLLAI